MKLLGLISLSRHHATLCNKVDWYSKWHEHPHHKHIHWLTFSIFILFSGIIVYNSYVLGPSVIWANKDDEKITGNADKETPAIEDVGVSIPSAEMPESVEEKKGEENKEKEEEGLPAQAGIINIEEIAAFIEEQAENIDKININPNKENDEGSDEGNKGQDEDKEKKDEGGGEGNNGQDEDKEKKDEGGGEGNNGQDDIDKKENEKKKNVVEESVIVPVLGTATVLDVTSPIRNNKYRTGPITIYVVFSKPVEVVGSPLLAIATGNPAETLIDYKNGSGTNTLIFTYKIASTNFSSDLDYSSTDSLFLNNGSIKDSDGNNASIILPVPGAEHSLGGNKEIKIDTTIHMPTVLVPLVL